MTALSLSSYLDLPQHLHDRTVRPLRKLHREPTAPRPHMRPPRTSRRPWARPHAPRPTPQQQHVRRETTIAISTHSSLHRPDWATPCLLLPLFETGSTILESGSPVVQPTADQRRAGRALAHAPPGAHGRRPRRAPALESPSRSRSTTAHDTNRDAPATPRATRAFPTQYKLYMAAASLLSDLTARLQPHLEQQQVQVDLRPLAVQAAAHDFADLMQERQR